MRSKWLPSMRTSKMFWSIFSKFSPIDGIFSIYSCPGAVLFLFKLKTGKCILHTGDFRASPDMEEYPEFWNNDIHTIYLDTTYLSSKYEFPTQLESISGIIQFCREFVKSSTSSSGKHLIICGAYKVGKEKVWLRIAQEFNYKVWIDNERHKAMQCIQNDEINEVLTRHAKDASIHVLPLGNISYPVCWLFYPPNGLLTAFSILNNISHVFSLSLIMWVNLEKHSAKFLQFVPVDGNGPKISQILIIEYRFWAFSTQNTRVITSWSGSFVSWDRNKSYRPCHLPVKIWTERQTCPQHGWIKNWNPKEKAINEISWISWLRYVQHIPFNFNVFITIIFF